MLSNFLSYKYAHILTEMSENKLITCCEAVKLRQKR